MAFKIEKASESGYASSPLGGIRSGQDGTASAIRGRVDNNELSERLSSGNVNPPVSNANPY